MTAKNQKLRAVALSTIMLLSVFTLSAPILIEPAAADAHGNLELSDLDGDGTGDNPYTITNVSELQLVKEDLSANYQLGSDIDASDTQNWNTENGVTKGFEPIGNDSAQFHGTFDGNNHAISNLYINRSETTRVGLFGNVSGVIEDLHVVEADITGQERVGGVVGSLEGGSVINASASGTITSDPVDASDAGGLVGISFGVINRSHATANVTGAGSSVGGLVGASVTDQATVEHSHATGNVTNTGGGTGGLVGYSEGYINESLATGNVSGSNAVGGVVGLSIGSVDGAYALGDVDGTVRIGGVAGQSGMISDRGGGPAPGSINQTYASGAVTGDDEVGGLIGNQTNAQSTLNNSYWDKGETGQSTAIGTRHGGTTDTVQGTVTDEMIGSAAVGNMTAFGFENRWESVVEGMSLPPFPDSDGYPILTAIDAETQLDQQGIGTTDVGPGSVTLSIGTPAAEFATAHWWNFTAGSGVNDTVKHIYLDYSGTGANVSAVAALDNDQINIAGYENVSEEVVSIEAESNDEILNITLATRNEQLDAGEHFLVQTFDHELENPPVGKHTVSMRVASDEGVFDSAETTIETVAADAVSNEPISDEVADHVIYRSIDQAGTIEAIQLDYSDATFAEDHIAFTGEAEVTIDGDHVTGEVYTAGSETIVVDLPTPRQVQPGDDVAIELNDGMLNPSTAGTTEVELRFLDASFDPTNPIETTTANLTIHEGAFLNGTITEAQTGETLSNVTVRAKNDTRELDWRFDQLLDEATTDENGQYSLYLPKGDTVDRLEVERQFYTDPTNTSANEFIGGSDLDFALEQRGIITGTVTNEFGSLVRHDTVRVRNGTYRVRADTGTEGNFSAEVDPAKSPFVVEIQPPLHNVKRESGVHVETLNTTVQDLSGVGHQSDRTTINGTVTDTSGTPLEDGRVIVRNESAFNLGMVVEYVGEIDQNGEYEIDVPANSIRVETDVDAYNDTSRTDLAANGPFDFSLDPVVNLQGTVTDEHGAPLQGAGVSVFHPQQPGAEAFQETNESGSYSIDVDGPEGEYFVHVSEPNGEYDDRFATGVQLTPGATKQRDFELPFSASITGTVQDESGNPVPGARLDTWDTTYTVSESTVSDRNGEFELAVSPGTFEIQIEDLAARNPDIARTRVGDIDVGPNETVDIGAVTVSDPGTIEGQVTNESGAVQGTFVIVEGDGQTYFDTTDSDGNYSVDVAPGSYRVTVFGNDHSAAPVEVGVTAGETNRTDIELVRSEILHSNVTVIDEGSGSVTESDLGVSAGLESGIMNIELINTSASADQLDRHELETLGVSNDTEFRINITVTNYTATSLLWGARDVTWETAENRTAPSGNATDITITTKPINLQVNEEDPDGEPLQFGPVMTRSPSDIQWPESQNDQASIGLNRTVLFGLFDMATAPPAVRDTFRGMTVTTNAQAFAPPRIEDDSLAVWLAGPSRTVEGDTHSGFYQAFIPDSQLDAWGISDPESELNALYRGDTTDFTVDESPADGAWIEISNISYSAGYIEVEADPEEPSDPDPSPGPSPGPASDRVPRPEVIEDLESIEALDPPDDVELMRAERAPITVDEETGQARVTFTEASTTESITFDDADIDGEVTVAEYDTEPAETGPAPGRSVAVSQITVPDPDQPATIRKQIPSERLEDTGVEATDLRINRFVDGAWQGLETEIVDRTDRGVVLEADTPGFSFFSVSAVGEPEAVIDAPAEIETGEEVTLDGSGSSDPYGAIAAYEWSIDGDTLSGETVTAALEEAGDYTVTLTVENDGGETDTAETTVTVLEDDTAAETDAEPEPAPGTDSGPEPEDQNGFGILVTLVALLGAVLVARRRFDR